MLAGLPAVIGQMLGREGKRSRLKSCGNGVVPAVEIAEKTDDSDDLDDLCIVEMLTKILEVAVGREVRDLSGVASESERGSLGIVEPVVRLEGPDVGDLVSVHSQVVGMGGGMSLAIATSSCCAGDMCAELYQGRIDVTCVHHRGCEWRKRVEQSRDSSHGWQAARDKPHGLLDQIENGCVLRQVGVRERLDPSHGQPTLGSMAAQGTEPDSQCVTFSS